MQMNPYLFFNGNCEEAFKFYAATLGGRIDVMMVHEGTPAAEHTPKEWLKKIIHASMSIGDLKLMASDAPPGHYHKPQGSAVALQIDDPAEAERIFKAISAGGEVGMPAGPTFFARYFGMCVDRFGTHWMVNCPPASTGS